MQILNEQTLHDFEALKYPFAASASLSTDDITIPESLFLDANLQIPAGAASPAYISKIDITGLDITLTFSTGSGTVVGLCTFKARTSTTDDETEEVAVYSGSGTYAGLLLLRSDVIPELLAYATGSYVLPASSATLCSFCCLPRVESSVSGFILPDGSVTSGDVWFVGGDGVTLQTIETSDGSGLPGIQVNAVGDTLFLQAACGAEVDFSVPVALKAIQLEYGDDAWLVLPDTYGAVTIEVGGHTGQDSTALRLNRVSTAELEIELLGTGLSE